MKTYELAELTCSKCERLLPAEMFRLRIRRNARGYIYKYREQPCKDCRYTPHPRPKKPPKPPRTCKVCGAVVGKSRRLCPGCKRERQRENSKRQYYKNRSDPGFQERHRREARERMALRRKSRTEEERLAEQEALKVRKRRREHRFMVLPHDLTVEDWLAALEYFGNRCAYCGEAGELHQEHFVPLAKGGGYTKKNIVPACPTCNLAKNASMPLDWLKTRPDGLATYERIMEYFENKE